MMGNQFIQQPMAISYIGHFLRQGLTHNLSDEDEFTSFAVSGALAISIYPHIDPHI